MPVSTSHLADAGPTIARARLTEAISPNTADDYVADSGNSVKAKFMRWGKHPEVYYTLENRGEFKLYDFTNTVSGRANDEFWVISTKRGWEILSRVTQAALYAVAYENWRKATGGPPARVATVKCHPCDDALGANPTVAVNLVVDIISTTGEDPNVESGHVLTYLPGTDGRLVGQGKLCDGEIGEFKQVKHSRDPRPGWRECTAEERADGTTDCRGRVLRGIDADDAPGDEVGADSVTVDPHPDHGHNLIADNFDATFADPGAGGVAFVVDLKEFTSGVYENPVGVKIDDDGDPVGTRTNGQAHNPASVVQAGIAVRIFERYDNSAG